MIVRYKVAIESQPLITLCKVTFRTPSLLTVIPFHSKGTSVSQIVTIVLLESSGSTLRIIDAVESQPLSTELNTIDCVPDAFNNIPFHVYGSNEEQIETFSVLDKVWFTTKFIVINESHPFVLKFQIARNSKNYKK